MRNPTEIKRLEKETLVAYIRKLHASLSETPLTNAGVELEKSIWEKLYVAESEYALL